MKLSTKLHLYSMTILLVMTLSVLLAGIVTINKLARELHYQTMFAQLGEIRESIVDTLNQSGIKAAVEEARRLQDELTKGSKELQSLHIYILEEPDKVIYHPNYDMGDRIERSIIKAQLGKSHGSLEYHVADQVNFAVYRTFEPLGWTFFISLNEDEVYPEEGDYLRNIILISLAIFALSALFVSRFVGRAAARLETTLVCINQIENGDLNTRIPITAQDELGRLQAGINTMSASLQARTQKQQEAEDQLRKSETKFRDLVQKVQAAVIVYGPETQILTANWMAQELLGLSEDQLLGRSVNDPVWHFLREDGSAMPLDEYPVNRVLTSHRALQNKVVGLRRSDREEPLWTLVNALPVKDESNGITQVIVSFTDITERKKSEQQLSASEQLFRTLVENSPDHIARYDTDLRRVYINPALEEQFLAPKDQVLGQTSKVASPLIDTDRYMANLRKVINSGEEVADEIAYHNPQGKICWASTRFAPEFGIEGKVQSVLVISNNISKQKQAELERLEYTHFLESLDRITQILNSENNIEELLKRFLDEVLDIFDCDRAYLQYPCDPEASTEWWMPMERCNPDYPSPLPPNRKLPYHPHFVETLRAIVNSDTPIKLGPNTDHPIPPEVTDKLGVRSLMAIALHPKVDRPWHFGIHQCAYDRTWTDQEVRLFEEISHRMSDGLNNLLITRDLRESEERFRLVFENSPVSIQEEDYSEVKHYLDSLKTEYGDKLSDYLIEHPEVVEKCAALVKIVDINRAALRLHDADDKQTVLQGLSQVFLAETLHQFREVLVALMAGETHIRKESTLKTVRGKQYANDAFISVCPGYEQTLGKMLISLIDITELKQAEQDRQQHLHFLESLDRVNRILQEEGNIEQVMNKALDEILEIFDCDRVYLLYPCDPNAALWSVPLERTKPDYPGLQAHGGEFPVDDNIAKDMRLFLESDHPVRFGPKTEFPVADFLQYDFQIRSMIATALYPRVDNPWVFGMHQCDHDRVWSDQELRLFEEISHRLSDGLNDLLVTRNLQESEERFRLVYENSPVPIWEEDFSAVKKRLDELSEVHGDDLEIYLQNHPEIVKECASIVKIINVNSAALDLHEADTKQILFEGLPNTFIKESYDAFRNELIAISQDKTEIQFDGVVKTLKGKRREINLSFSVCPGYEQSLSKVFISMFDITQRKQDEEQLRLAASVFSTSQEGIMISNPSNRIIDVNPAFTRLTGYSREEALGRNPSFLSAGRQTPDFYNELWNSLNTKGEWQGEIWNRRKCGEIYPELLSIVAVKNIEGQLQHYVGAFSDISMIKQHEADLDHIAHYDMLTSVPNRRLLSDRMEQAIAHTSRHGWNLAVCYLDLDGFKPINDQYGHEYGDLMLIEIANRLQNMSRGEDTVARLGGDEFVLLWNDIGSEANCMRALERIMNKLSEPMTLKGETLTVSASIGVTIYPDDNVDADSLLRHADHAMYTAKQLGKNRYQIFDARLEREILAQSELLTKVERGLAEDQFVLHYQPKVDFTTGEVVGVEALLRWADPVLGLIHPNEFLSLIESDSLALKVGRWVIEEAIRQAKQWDNQGICLPISINIFPRHLKSQTFIRDLQQAIAVHWSELPKHRLLLEIVETSDLEELEPIDEVITECLKIGIGFSLDDFGTGYSSLVYLRRLSIEELKIDQSFVRDMLIDPDDAAIVFGVISLGNAFNLRVVAEGVEDNQQAKYLVNLGCTIVQGYGMGRPMAANDFEQWYSEHVSQYE